MARKTRLTAADQATVDRFAEFLSVVGKPDGRAFDRLREQGREDLIEYAMGGGPVEMRSTMINDRWELLLPEHRAVRPEWPTWEAERLDSMHTNLRPGMVVYDVGAEEGDMPALWATWGCAVALFEPNPRVWPNMRAIWGANQLPPPEACFVGFAGPTDTPLAAGLAGTGWFPSWPPAAYGPVIGDHGFMNLCERPDVPRITLNTAATTVRPPDAITIDVEGAELEVLRGAAAHVLTNIRPLLWISVHPTFMGEMYGQHPDELHSLLIGHGYIGTLLADDHEEHWFYEPTERRSS